MVTWVRVLGPLDILADMSHQMVLHWTLQSQLFLSTYPSVQRWSLWHHVANPISMPTDLIGVCEWLKYNGKLDLINTPDAHGMSPLHNALECGSEKMARWMMQNGADINAVAKPEHGGATVFFAACEGGCSRPLLQELADKVTPDHLTKRDTSLQGESPMHRLFFYCPRDDYSDFIQMLVLRGVPVLPEDFPIELTYNCDPSNVDGTRRHDIYTVRLLIKWAEYELKVHRTWVALVLGCGVLGDRDAPPAQRSQLLKLRGDGNTEARMRIARSLGVRVGAQVVELGRLRRAASVWQGQLSTITAGGGGGSGPP